MILLWVLLDALYQYVRRPKLKREWIVCAYQHLCEELGVRSRVDDDMIQRSTGRLTILSQIFPELRHPLARSCIFAVPHEVGSFGTKTITLVAIRRAKVKARRNTRLWIIYF